MILLFVAKITKVETCASEPLFERQTPLATLPRPRFGDSVTTLCLVAPCADVIVDIDFSPTSLCNARARCVRLPPFCIRYLVLLLLSDKSIRFFNIRVVCQTKSMRSAAMFAVDLYQQFKSITTKNKRWCDLSQTGSLMFFDRCFAGTRSASRSWRRRAPTASRRRRRAASRERRELNSEEKENPQQKNT